MHQNNWYTEWQPDLVHHLLVERKEQLRLKENGDPFTSYLYNSNDTVCRLISWIQEVHHHDVWWHQSWTIWSSSLTIDLWNTYKSSTQLRDILVQLLLQVAIKTYLTQILSHSGYFCSIYVYCFIVLKVHARMYCQYIQWLVVLCRLHTHTHKHTVFTALSDMTAVYCINKLIKIKICSQVSSVVWNGIDRRREDVRHETTRK